MKLVLVGPTPPFRGGISQYTASLHRALAQQHEVLLISFSRQYPSLIFPGKTQQEESPEAFGTQGEPLLDSIRPASWRRAAGRILSFGADAVVFQWWQPFFSPAYCSIASRLKKATDVSLFFLCHNVYPHETLRVPGGRALVHYLIARAFRRADGFLVHSQKLERQVRRFNSSAPIRRIYHPRYDFYSHWDHVPAPLTESASPHLLFFGTVRPYKGLEVFLEALGLLTSRLDFKATVAGEFYVDAGPFRRLARRSGLSERLIWKDRYVSNSDVPRLFRSADLVVLPYLRATQSGVVPLAYQFDVPVIASDVGGLSEIVIDGETGYLVPPGDARTLARRILEYFEQGKKLKFQTRIRAFKRRLSWQQVVDNILALQAEVREGSAGSEDSPKGPARSECGVG